MGTYLEFEIQGRVGIFALRCFWRWSFLDLLFKGDHDTSIFLNLRTLFCLNQCGKYKYIVVMRFFGGVKFAKLYNGLKNFWDSIKEN